MATELTCHFCGVKTRKDGRPFEKQGQLNLHEYHCKMKTDRNNISNVSHETKEQPKEEECNHNWRFLNTKSPIERRAYKAGYMEVCIKCQEVK